MKDIVVIYELMLRMFTSLFFDGVLRNKPVFLLMFSLFLIRFP